MVCAQNWAIKVEKLLNKSMEQANATEAELEKKSEDMAKLEAVVAELKAVENAASKQLGEGFDFCKRKLVVHHPNLGIDLAAMDMDHELLKKEGREAEKKEIREDEQEKGNDNINPLSP